MVNMVYDFLIYYYFKKSHFSIQKFNRIKEDYVGGRGSKKKLFVVSLQQ